MLDRRILGIAAAQTVELAAGISGATVGERTAGMLQLEVPIAEQIELRPDLARRLRRASMFHLEVSIAEQIELLAHAARVRPEL